MTSDDQTLALAESSDFPIICPLYMKVFGLLVGHQPKANVSFFRAEDAATSTFLSGKSFLLR